MVDDVWDAAQSLHIIDDGGLAEETDDGGKWRLPSGVGALAFQRIEQPGFITAHVTPATQMQMQFEAVLRTENMFAEIMRLIGFRDRPRKTLGRQDILAAQKDVGDISLNCESRDNHAFDEL